MDLKITTLKSGKVNFHFHHAFRISQGGFFHLPIMVISIGNEGFGVHILGISIGIGWKE